MARISTYPLDSTVVGTDKLIGTDQDNATSTKNYAISDLGAYFNELILQPGLVEYTDNADAIAGGLVSGQIYRTGDDLKIVH